MEGRKDYNQSGVPHYASNNTQANREHPSSWSRPSMQKSVHQDKLNKRFKVIPGGHLARKYGDDATGTITYIGPENFSYQIDGSDQKFTYSVKSIPYVLEIIE